MPTTQPPRTRPSLGPATAAPALAVLLAAAALLACGGAGAVSGTAEQRVRAAAREVIDACRNESWKAAALYFVYRGPDASRQWKDTYRPADADEVLKVKGAHCSELTYRLPAGEWRFGEFFTETEPEGTWHVQRIDGADGSEGPYLAMLEIDGQFAIGDID